jgi:hypothetical protein
MLYQFHLKLNLLFIKLYNYIKKLIFLLFWFYNYTICSINYIVGEKINIISITHDKKYTYSLITFKIEGILRKIGVVRPINKEYWSQKKLIKKLNEAFIKSNEYKPYITFSTDINKNLNIILPLHIDENMEIKDGIMLEWIDFKNKPFNILQMGTFKKILRVDENYNKNDFISLKYN